MSLILCIALQLRCLNAEVWACAQKAAYLPRHMMTSSWHELFHYIRPHVRLNVWRHKSCVILLQTLHPWQEACADLYSHPWHPDLWALCNILASRSTGEPQDISAAATGSASSLLPHFSAAEMLWAPILARGGGMQMKREPRFSSHTHDPRERAVLACK